MCGTGHGCRRRNSRACSRKGSWPVVLHPTTASPSRSRRPAPAPHRASCPSCSAVTRMRQRLPRARLQRPSLPPPLVRLRSRRHWMQGPSSRPKSLLPSPATGSPPCQCRCRGRFGPRASRPRQKLAPSRRPLRRCRRNPPLMAQASSRQPHPRSRFACLLRQTWRRRRAFLPTRSSTIAAIGEDCPVPSHRNRLTPHARPQHRRRAGQWPSPVPIRRPRQTPPPGQ